MNWEQRKYDRHTSSGSQPPLPDPPPPPNASFLLLCQSSQMKLLPFIRLCGEPVSTILVPLNSFFTACRFNFLGFLI